MAFIHGKMGVAVVAVVYDPVYCIHTGWEPVIQYSVARAPLWLNCR